MPVESVTYVSDLNTSWPLGTGEPKSLGDDHIRNLKLALRNTFPNINGAVNPTPAQLNQLASLSAVSVLGRSANSAGAPAAIAAAANDRIFRRVGDALDFGTITGGMFPAGAVSAPTTDLTVQTLNGKTPPFVTIAELADATFATHGAALVGYRQSATASARTLGARLREVVSVHDYGAVGDGVTNDVAAIQAALDSGAKLVVCDPTKTYLVNHVSTFTVNAVNYRRCLSVPAGVELNGCGATIKLGAAQNSSIVALLASNAALVNVILDCNRTNQTSPATGEMANVIAYDVDTIRVENVRARNARQYAGRFMNVRKSRFVGLYCEDSYGDGWSMGTSGSLALELFDCIADQIFAENCEGTYAGLEGNGIIVTAIRTKFGLLAAKDCHGGTKIQNTTADTTIDTSYFDGDDHTFGSANSGTKLQGFNAGSLWVNRVSIGKVISRNCYGNGLLVRQIGSVQIGQYIGYNNGSGAGAAGSDRNDSDLDLGNGTAPNSLQIGAMVVEQPKAIGIRFLNSAATVGSVHIDSIVVRNTVLANEAVQNTMTDVTRVWIGRLRAIDDQGVPVLTYAYRNTGGSIEYIDSIECNLAHSTVTPRVLLAAAGKYQGKIRSIRVGSSDNLEGVVQLTNGAATTAVACGHIWRTFIGGASDYFHPIIEVTPWDTSARALSGRFSVTVTDGGTGTGFTINHPTAGASDFVHWKLVGWMPVSQAQS